ncbi:MAG: FHA domain-containing protein [Opitutales bacterium]
MDREQTLSKFTLWYAFLQGLAGKKSAEPGLKIGEAQSSSIVEEVEPEGEEGSFPHVRIDPDSDETREQTLLRGREIRQRNFLIGRRKTGAEPNPEQLPDFIVCEHEPFTVSKNHCLIELVEDGVVVRDLGSRFGCVLNGEKIGGAKGMVAEKRLGAGEHTLVLGRKDGPYRFRLTIRPAM